MTKILIIGMTANPGGIESFVMNYYRHINRQQIQFDFLCNSTVVAYEEEILQLGGKVYRVTARGKNLIKNHHEIKKFFKYKSSDYSAIWANMCSLINIDYLKYAKQNGISCRIIHSHNDHNMDGILYGIIHRMHRKLIKKYATHFWACSDDAGKWFYNKQILNGDRFKIINNAIETEKFKYNQEIRDEYRLKFQLQNKFIVGNVGRFHFQKNQLFLLDIFNEIIKQKSDAVLMLVGQGEDEKKLKEKVKKLKLEDAVIFMGVRSDVSKLLQAMDVFVFPSLFEGLPISLLEAQASGLPCFVSSEGVTLKSKVTSNLQFISLKKTSEKWAEQIIYYKDLKGRNCDVMADFRKAGYDINDAVREMEDFFEKNNDYKF